MKDDYKNKQNKLIKCQTKFLVYLLNRNKLKNLSQPESSTKLTNNKLLNM